MHLGSPPPSITTLEVEAPFASAARVRPPCRSCCPCNREFSWTAPRRIHHLGAAERFCRRFFFFPPLRSGSFLPVFSLFSAACTPLRLGPAGSPESPDDRVTTQTRTALSTSFRPPLIPLPVTVSPPLRRCWNKHPLFLLYSRT